MVFYPIRSDLKAFNLILSDSPEFWLGLMSRHEWGSFQADPTKELGLGQRRTRRNLPSWDRLRQAQDFPSPIPSSTDPGIAEREWNDRVG